MWGVDKEKGYFMCISACVLMEPQTEPASDHKPSSCHEPQSDARTAEPAHVTS